MPAAFAKQASTQAGLEHGQAKRRYFDQKYDRYIVKVLPGEYFISNDPEEMLVTVLGSCVSACIFDPLAGIGGMNHFMLPMRSNIKWGSNNDALRYGDYALEVLINGLLKRGSGNKGALEIKIFGGGQVINTSSNIGLQNANFVKTYLQREGLNVLAEDLGTTHARRIHFYPTTGKVLRKYISDQSSAEVARSESSYSAKIEQQDQSGDIELFTD